MDFKALEMKMFKEAQQSKIDSTKKEMAEWMAQPAPETELEKERHTLGLNKIKRCLTFYQELWFINHLLCCQDNGKKPKGIRYRKHLDSSLRFGAEHTFKTEEEEYQFIGKFGRGIWDENGIRNNFNKADQEKILYIANQWGAFDY